MRRVVEPHFLNLSANSRFALRAEHRRFDLNLRRPFSFAGCRRSRRRQGNVNLATRTNALTQRLVRSWSGPPRINIDGAPASMRFLHRVSASSCAPGYSRSQKSRKDLGTLAAPRSTTRHTDHSAASAQSGAASPSPDCARARGLPLRGEARSDTHAIIFRRPKAFKRFTRDPDPGRYVVQVDEDGIATMRPAEPRRT